ncbi:hypothetical protein SORBI_3002G007900 [Sorghum bicolor]|uniref:Uncharacterized protein n=1 Tax=Sorghum bicolor TaxID=4558 RepID=A0A1B6Q8M7_SORBI|nr:hypothetical protein SORBI_3002G007900 [Sorghum bicolor]
MIRSGMSTGHLARNRQPTAGCRLAVVLQMVEDWNSLLVSLVFSYLIINNVQVPCRGVYTFLHYFLCYCFSIRIRICAFCRC